MPTEIKDLAILFRQLKIKFYYLTKAVTQRKREFAIKDSLFILLHQTQKSLLFAMLDNRKEFIDPNFYDVSSWNLEDAYDLNMVINICFSSEKVYANALYFICALN